MEACLGLGRSKSNLNEQNNVKLQDQHHQQHTQLQQQKQRTQAIISKQNYYTTQQQPKNQCHPAARGQTTNIDSLQPGLHQHQQLYEEESLLVRQQQLQRNVQTTPCTTPSKYRNIIAAKTTKANMQQLSLSKANDKSFCVGSGVQELPQPQTISFQKKTVMMDVTPTLHSTVDPTNTISTIANSNVKTFRKINRQPQHQRLEQKQHQYHHILCQQQQKQLETHLDAIEVCVEPEPHASFKGAGDLLIQTKTLGRLNHQHQHHHSTEDPHGQWTQISSLQLLQLQQQQHQQHDYSYAYYEPGATMKHTNIPHAVHMAGANEDEDLIPPPPNSIRALLLKGKKNKLLVSPTTRESYQINLTQQQSRDVAGTVNCSNISIPENFYEEISASSTSSSSNSMTRPHQLKANCHSAGTLTHTLVKEELERVQNRHDKVLEELNLSVEAMLMPESPPNSLTDENPPAVSVTTASGQPLRLISSSADNICNTALMGEPADDFISPIPNSAVVIAGFLQSSCLASDLDSGFSGSSGASYIGSLRLHKTKALMSSRSSNLPTTTTTAIGNNAAAKGQKSASSYETQSCRSCKRADSHNVNANATASSAMLATTSPRSIKYLLQIHQNTKQEQQHLHHHQQQQHQQSQLVNGDLHNSSSFFTQASCGCRILNCAKIRAAEDPGPVVLNAQPIESKARSFWKRKGWRKQPGFSTSGSSIHDAG